MACIFDERWIGEHGIGRFARELSSRLPHVPLKVGGRPMSPFDPVRLLAAETSKTDWFLSPGYNAPLFSKIPYIMTIHDLNHIDRRDNSSAGKRLYYRTLLRRLAKNARAVFTVSDFSRQRIIDWFKLNPAAVFNIGNGVSETFSLVGEKYTPGVPYFLCVSNRKGHKNELGVLSAFARARVPDSTHLIFTGPPSQDLLALALELNIDERIEFSGHVLESELAALYRGALALVFPSFYEGFGLPIVEAFACGTPVITSNVTSMPEIAGKAALLVNPSSVDDIAEAMVLLNNSIELRQNLKDCGLQKVSTYTWDAVAERVKAAVGVVDVDSSRPLCWS